MMWIGVEDTIAYRRAGAQPLLLEAAVAKLAARGETVETYGGTTDRQEARSCCC